MSPFSLREWRCKCNATVGSLVCLTVCFSVSHGELAEVVEADIAPFAGILQLVFQTFVDLAPALFVDMVAHQVVPQVVVLLDGDDTAVVVVLQRLPQGGAVFHAVGPGYAVEP